MRSTSARRELAFVLAVAAAGLALVLVVVFAPWYSPGGHPSAADPAAPTGFSQLIDGPDGGSGRTP